MGRLVFNWVCVLALVALPVTGCSDESTGMGGTGDTGGTGGMGGDGGTGGGVVSCDGTVCPCSEGGILAAIAAGGGPYTFSCDGPTPVILAAEIEIDNDVVLDGEGNLTLDGSMVDLMLRVSLGVTATLSGITIKAGNAGIINDGSLNLAGVIITDLACGGDQCGIGVWNRGTMTIMDSTVSNNSFFNPGAIVNFNDGELTVLRSRISDNRLMQAGISSSGNILILESEIARNLGGIVSGEASAMVVNSTFSANENFGIDGSPTTTIVNSTIVGSTAVRGQVTMQGTLISGDCENGVTSAGHNIESPGDACGFDRPTDQVDVTEGELNLGPLQDNGGPTMTHALLPGSVAIDVIPADMCEVDTDQRGVDRPQGDACDLGSFELEGGRL